MINTFKITTIAALSGLILTGCNGAVLSDINVSGELQAITSDDSLGTPISTMTDNGTFIIRDSSTTTMTLSNDTTFTTIDSSTSTLEVESSGIAISGLNTDFAISPLSDGAMVRLNVTSSNCGDYENGNVGFADLLSSTGAGSYLTIDTARYDINTTACGNQALEALLTDRIFTSLSDNDIVIDNIGLWSTSKLVADDSFDTSVVYLGDDASTLNNDGLDINGNRLVFSNNTSISWGTAAEPEHFIAMIKLSDESTGTLAGKTILGVCSLQSTCPEYIGVLNESSPLELLQATLENALNDGDIGSKTHSKLSDILEKSIRATESGRTKKARHELQKLLKTARKSGSAALVEEIRSFIAQM